VGLSKAQFRNFATMPSRSAVQVGISIRADGGQDPNEIEVFADREDQFGLCPLRRSLFEPVGLFFLSVFDVDPAKLFSIDCFLRTSSDHRSKEEKE
jgi:hypothetical protein